MKGLFLALFISGSAWSQQAVMGTDRFQGLDDTDAPYTLQDGEAQSSLNVETNLLGTALIKRKGYVQIASLPVSTAAINGAYQFIDKNGNVQVIVCENAYCSHSVNGGTFSTIYSTATSGTLRWSFVDYNGIIYAVDDKNDQPWSYDGTTFTQPFSVSVPNGSLIEQTKDRLIISGVTTNPNGVYYSQSGVFTNFTTGGNSPDPWIDTIGTTGDKVTGVKYDSGNLYIFKRASITLCIPQDQFSTICYPLSNTIGTNSPASIVSAPDGIYFESQTGEYWKIPTYGLYGIELISKKISNLVKSQPSQFGNTGSNFQGIQSDWNAGKQSPGNSWSTNYFVGSIVNSSGTFIDSTTAKWNLGTQTNIWAYHPNNVLTLSTNTQSAQNNNPTYIFGSGTNNFLNTNPSSVTYNFSEAGGVTDATQYGYESASTTTIAYGTWTATLQVSGHVQSGLFTIGNVNWFFMSDTPTASLANGYSLNFFGNTGLNDSYTLSLLKYINGSPSTLSTQQIVSGFDILSCNFTVIRDGVAGKFTVAGANNALYNGDICGQYSLSATDNANLISNYTVIQATGITHNGIGAGTSISIGVFGQNFPINYYVTNSTGLFQSGLYDTGYSTPTSGPLTISSNVPVGTTLNFAVRSCTSASGAGCSSWSSFNNGTNPNLTNEFYQYEASFTNVGSTYTAVTPSISYASLGFAATGQFYTQCIQPGPNISSFGLLTCDTSGNVGAGSEVFYATSAATCASLPTTFPQMSPKWTQQTNNTALTISTGQAIYIGFASLLGSATDQARVNSCTLNWLNGTLPQTVFSAYDPVKNAIYWTTANNSMGTNNRMLKYDLNLSMQGLNPWFPMGLNATAVRVINNSLYFGSASSSTWNQYGVGNADNGLNINAIWQSKDFSCQAPYADSSWNKTYTMARNQNQGTVSQIFTDSLGNTETFSIITSTTSNLNYVRANHYLQKFSPAPFANLTFTNNSQVPFEINAFNMECFANPPRMENP